MLWGRPMFHRVLSSIPGPQPPGASSIPSPAVVIPKVSRRRPGSPGHSGSLCSPGLLVGRVRRGTGRGSGRESPRKAGALGFRAPTHLSLCLCLSLSLSQFVSPFSPPLSLSVSLMSLSVPLSPPPDLLSLCLSPFSLAARLPSPLSPPNSYSFSRCSEPSAGEAKVTQK